MTKIQLSLHKNYVSDWDQNYAIREIVQNIIDNPSNNIIAQENGVLFLGNEEGKLDRKTLLLGNSTKQSNDYIGEFGEGYKLALLVLVRMGCSIKIFTHDELWTPYFEKHDVLDEDVLCIKIEKSKKENIGILFMIEGLKDMTETLNSIMLNRKQCEVLHQTKEGEIIKVHNFDNQGKLYINDMYVTDISGFEFSYNLKPSGLKLGRDRNIVNDFDVILITSRMLATFPDKKRLANLIKKDKKDIQFMDIYKGMLDKEVIEILSLEYDNVIPIAYNEDVKSYKAKYDMSGLTCKSMPSVIRSILPKKKLKPKVKFTTEDFYKKHYRQFTKEMKRDWNKIQ